MSAPTRKEHGQVAPTPAPAETPPVAAPARAPPAPAPTGYAPAPYQPGVFGPAAYPPQAQLPPTAYGYPPPAAPYGAAPGYPVPGTPYPPPPGYPVPYGYAPPFGIPPPLPLMPTSSPGRGTVEALERWDQMTLAGVAASAATFFIGIVAWSHYATGDMQTTLVDPAGIPLHVISLMVQVMAVGLGWVAVDDLKDAAFEIHGEHQEATKRAVNFLYLATVVWFVGGVGGIATSIGSFVAGLGGAPSLTEASIAFQVIFGATGVAFNVLVAMALQTALSKVMKESGRSKTGLFYALALGGTGVAFALSMASLLVLGGANLAPLASMVSLVSFVVLRFQVKSAVEGARVLAVTHGLDPDVALPAASPV